MNIEDSVVHPGEQQPVIVAPLKKKGGRPKGSKNKSHGPETSRHGRAFNLGGSPEKTEEADAKLEKIVERKLDQESSQSDSDVNTQLEKALAKIAEYERLHKKWVLGDYSDYGPEHPFELIIQTDDRWNLTEKVPLFVNGHDYSCLRGIPVKVPKKVVDMLNNAKIEATQKMAMPDGSVQQCVVNQHRYPFTARPLIS